MTFHVKMYLYFATLYLKINVINKINQIINVQLLSSVYLFILWCCNIAYWCYFYQLQFCVYSKLSSFACHLNIYWKKVVAQVLP